MGALALALATASAALGLALLGRRLETPGLVPAAGVPEGVPFLGGYPPATHIWHRFHIRYYAMALLFLAFDMEMVFMYPWAVVFVREGSIALIEMLMFIVILLLGVLYGWREGAFEWA